MTNEKYLEKANVKDTYIALLLEDGRKKALRKGLITEKDIKRVGPALSNAEMKKLFSRITWTKSLYFITKSSLGKIEMLSKRVFKK